MYTSASALTEYKRHTTPRDQAIADVCTGLKRHPSRDHSESIKSAVPVATIPMTEGMRYQEINDCHKAHQKILGKDDMYMAPPALLTQLRMDMAKEESPQPAPAA